MMASLRKVLNVTLVILFLAAIWLPLASEMLQIAPVIEVTENRNLTSSPVFVLKKSELKKYPQRFENYFNDHFGFRNMLVKWHNYLSYNWLKTSDRVLIGKDGWLFLARGVREDRRTIPIVADRCGRAPFDDVELDKWVGALEANWRAIDQRNMEYLLVIVPNKHSVYPQYLPTQINCSSGGSRADQLGRGLQRLDGFPLLDLREAFIEQAKDSEPLFRQTDTHWDGHGIVVAYQAMMSGIDVEDVIDAGRVTLKEVGAPGGDLARLLGMERALTERAYGLRIKPVRAQRAVNPFPELTKDPSRQPAAREQQDSDLPRLMVFHDSFVGNSVKNLLSESFSRSVFVWQGGPELSMSLIDREKPDIIIHEMVERNLLNPYFATRHTDR
ncbi:MAG: hypothetical protein OEU36_03285 [Gammaproteobacteria bacterium]|nr:hypothetical protein [Gammaproteobacteria bacterium]